MIMLIIALLKGPRDANDQIYAYISYMILSTEYKGFSLFECIFNAAIKKSNKQYPMPLQWTLQLLITSG